MVINWRYDYRWLLYSCFLYIDLKQLVYNSHHRTPFPLMEGSRVFFFLFWQFEASCTRTQRPGKKNPYKKFRLLSFWFGGCWYGRNKIFHVTHLPSYFKVNYLVVPQWPVKINLSSKRVFIQRVAESSKENLSQLLGNQGNGNDILQLGCNWIERRWLGCL